MTDSPSQVAFRVGRAAFFFRNPEDVEILRNFLKKDVREAFDLGYEQEAAILAWDLQEEKMS